VQGGSPTKEVLEVAMVIAGLRPCRYESTILTYAGYSVKKKKG
jgi:hypothetical protein